MKLILYPIVCGKPLRWEGEALTKCVEAQGGQISIGRRDKSELEALARLVSGTDEAQQLTEVLLPIISTQTVEAVIHY